MSFLGVEVGAAVEDEDQVVGPGLGPVELQPRLVPRRAVVRHPQVVAVEVVDRDHLVRVPGNCVSTRALPAPVSLKMTDCWAPCSALCSSAFFNLAASPLAPYSAFQVPANFLSLAKTALASTPSFFAGASSPAPPGPPSQDDDRARRQPPSRSHATDCLSSQSPFSSGSRAPQ